MLFGSSKEHCDLELDQEEEEEEDEEAEAGQLPYNSTTRVTGGEKKRKTSILETSDAINIGCSYSGDSWKCDLH